MDNRRMRRLPLLLATLLLALVAGPAAGQNIYRCVEGDRTVFSDRPCPGAEVIRQSGSGVTRTVPAGAASDYRPPVAPGGVLPSAAELEGRCAAGDAGACDFLACANRNDQAACARAGGAPQGGGGSSPGWTAIATRDLQRPERDQATGVRVVREQEVTIECDDGRRGLVIARRDAGRFRLPDGSVRGSLAAAAAAICGR
jgi:hypothetical protein